MPTNGAAAQKATERAASERGLYRIGEVSRIADLKPFVLRYWETEFPMLEPVKSSSGHRLYRQEDVDLVLKIKRLLYDEGFTIAGARRHLREQAGSPDGEGAASAGRAHVPHDSSHAETMPQLLNRKMLLDLRDSLRAFLTLLEKRQ
jgi:DNA-binding transcriptional MerR regulator